MSSYIFLGPELGKKQNALDAVKNQFPGAEIEILYCGETPVNVIAGTIQSNSLFSSSRIIIIKNAELLKKKNEIDLLVSCINNLDKSAAVVFLSEEFRLAAALENAVPKANKSIFYEMFEREKTEWLRQFFRKEGFNIDSDGIDTILELVENNTEALRNECTRLIQFLQAAGADNKNITSEIIDKWLSHNREESAFTLFSRIASGDLCKSLESAAAILSVKDSKKNARAILGGLAWCFRKLGSYHALIERGEANNFVELKKIGLSAPKARDDYSAAARRYSAFDTEACLALTAEYEMLLSSPLSVMENILMDRYILAIVKKRY